MSQGKDPNRIQAPLEEESSFKESPTREVEIFELPAPPSGLELPPLPPGSNPELNLTPVDGDATPVEQPFPGLDPKAVAMVDQRALADADLQLPHEEQALLKLVDGSRAMDQLAQAAGWLPEDKLLGLLFELWRAGLINFR